MLTMKHFHDDEFTTKVYTFISEYNEKYPTLEDVLANLDLRYNLYCDYIEEYINDYAYNEQKKHNIHFNKIDFQKLRNHFPFDTISEIIAHTKKYISCNLSEKLPKIYPELDILLSIENTTRQWYGEDSNTDITYDIFKKIISLKTPFNDPRFKALPVHVSASNKRGLDRCILLKDEVGSFKASYDEETDSMIKKRSKSGYHSNFIDAKLGIIIYFKNKPSITISFNYDSQNNIYIHQVQCQPKDRGHYKIKGDWKLAAIKYLNEVFPEYNLHIIDGKTISNFIYNGYSEFPEYLKPSSDVLTKIQNLYDDLLPNFNNWFKKSGIKYREISC